MLQQLIRQYRRFYYVVSAFYYNKGGLYLKLSVAIYGLATDDTEVWPLGGRYLFYI
jgi:hypothetical protein